MAEVNSAQSTLVAAGSKIKHADHGRVEALVITTPATFTQLAINDTMASQQFIPKGSRILSCWVGNGTGTASSTIDIGLRKRDGTVVDADGIAAVHPIATATTIDVQASQGALVGVGVDYVTLDDVEVYLTAKGAVLAANQDVRVTVYYIGP